MRSKPKTSRKPKATEPVNAFFVELSSLHSRTTANAKLRRGLLSKGLAELDKNTGELQTRALFLMDEIEGSFRIIRRKLGS